MQCLRIVCRTAPQESRQRKSPGELGLFRSCNQIEGAQSGNVASSPKRSAPNMVFADAVLNSKKQTMSCRLKLYCANSYLSGTGR